MGFIGKVLGGIVALVGSLLGVLGKLFGLKKSEYYLELDEAKGTQPAAKAAPVAAAPEASAAVAAEAVVESPVQVAVAAVSAAPTNGSADEGVFASDFMIAPTMPRRRRPGPSLSGFKEMAKGMQRG
jgi:hypothetical protein